MLSRLTHRVEMVQRLFSTPVPRRESTDGPDAIATIVSIFLAVVPLACAAALAVTACSTYTWADANDDDTEPSAAIYVDAVSAPAHLGLDTSLLRAHLIDELHRQGVGIASSPNATTLRCALRREQTTGFGLHMVARIAFDCDIRHHGGDRPPMRLEATGLSTDGIAPGDDVAESAEATSRRAPTLAALDAISRLTPQIADELRGDPDSSFNE